MYEVDEQLVSLAKRLIQATMAGTIGWKVEGETQFQYDTPDSSVVVRAVNDDGEQPYAMELFDAKGVLVEELRSEWVPDPEDPWQQVPLGKNAVLADLYRSARRKAKNVDDVINSLLRSLNDEWP